MASLNIPIGSTFAERYRIVRAMAQGGMGAVYEVVHLETGKTRALKVMLPGMLQNREMHDRFRREARVTASIESEFIVDVVDAGVDPESSMPFLAMEYLRGEELDKKLKQTGAVSVEEAAVLLSQIAIALDKTHKASIVHRDLKPSNIFLTERDDGTPRVKILDFGIAKFVADGSTGAATTQNLGTPLYMAPEQFQAGSKIGPATDIFALGMMVYTMLVGVPYWQDELDAGTNVYAFVGLAMRGPTESARARAKRRGVSFPMDFDPWFARMTAHSPNDRFSNAKEAIEALRDVFGLGSGRSSSWGISALVSPPSSTQAPAAVFPALPIPQPPAPTPPIVSGPPPLENSEVAKVKTGSSSVAHTGAATANTLVLRPERAEKKTNMLLFFGGTAVAFLVVGGGGLALLSAMGVFSGDGGAEVSVGQEKAASSAAPITHPAQSAEPPPPIPEAASPASSAQTSPSASAPAAATSSSPDSTSKASASAPPKKTTPKSTGTNKYRRD